MLINDMTFNELKQLVDSGDAQAMLEMGELYYQGEQIERDTAMAVALWERATENSDNEIKLKAIQRLVQFYVEKNDEFAAIKWATKEEQFGSCGSVLNLFEERYPHKPAIYGGVKKDECAEVLRSFFKQVREK